MLHWKSPYSKVFCILISMWNAGNTLKSIFRQQPPPPLKIWARVPFTWKFYSEIDAFLFFIRHPLLPLFQILLRSDNIENLMHFQWPFWKFPVHYSIPFPQPHLHTKFCWDRMTMKNSCFQQLFWKFLPSWKFSILFTISNYPYIPNIVEIRIHWKFYTFLAATLKMVDVLKTLFTILNYTFIANFINDVKVWGIKNCVLQSIVEKIWHPPPPPLITKLECLGSSRNIPQNIVNLHLTISEILSRENDNKNWTKTISLQTSFNSVNEFPFLWPPLPPPLQ